jgi:excisionase family DNA binding protein
VVERLLKVPSVAERLNLSRSATYALLASGAIRSVSIGRARRVAESEVDRFIESRMAESHRGLA